MIITIDGPAGSGKSTVAKLLANKLGFIHFNSGSLFRGITAYFLSQNTNLSHIDKQKLKKIRLSTRFDGENQLIFVNSQNFSKHLRDSDVTIHSPIVSAVPEVRQIIDRCQRSFAKNNNLVIDGRDTGSHVFPNADFKFYLDCNLDERAKRRFNEEKIKNPKITLEQIKQLIIKRDEFDKNKPISPLVVPNGAIVIDSSSLSPEQVVDKMIEHIKQN